ncbi:phosphoribosylglycinamide formyltransferase [Luteimonas sp. A277]
MDSTSPQGGPLRIAALASGRGSNLQALIDAIAAGTLNARLVGVFSDRAGAVALDRARAAGVACAAEDPKAFPSRAAYDQALFAHVDAVQPDLVVCAGYMRLIGPAAAEARPGLLINIHPSLLPRYKGLHTHRRALEAGDNEHGASVHYVTADLDGGPVIAQARVPLLSGDDEESLAARVLGREHALLVEVVRWIANGRIRLEEHSVHVDGLPLDMPLQLGSNNRFA